MTSLVLVDYFVAVTALPRVLFIVNEVAHYGEFKRILNDRNVASKIEGHLLFDRDGYDPEIFFAGAIADCKRAGITYFTIPYGSFRETPERAVFSGLGRLLRARKLARLPGRKILTLLTDVVSGTHRQASYYARKIKCLADWIEEEKFVSVVLGEENVLLDTFVYARAAGQKRVVIYPYTIPNPKEMEGGACLTQPWNRLTGKVLYLFGGKWTRRSGDKVLLLLGPQKIMAMTLHRYFPSMPWVLNSEKNHTLCLESEAMAALYQRLGVAHSGLQVTGTVNDGIVAEILKQREARRGKLNERYGFTTSLPLVVVGFPPNQFPRAEAEYGSFDELVQALAGCLVPLKGKCHFLVCKHPRADHPFTALAEGGVAVTDEPLVEILPLADLYVASASATIRWAIAAGIPVLNYDLYRYHYGDYDSALAVVTVTDRENFSRALHRMVEDREHYGELKSRQATDARKWGHLDGASADRLLKVFTGSALPTP